MKWLRNYLNNSTQFVDYCGTLSKTNFLRCGVPQGSILGSLLFILYINDFANISKSLFPIMYADDTNAFMTGRNNNELMVSLNFELSKIKKWLECNKLSLNVAKIHYIIF